MLALRSRTAGPDGRPLLSWETAVDRFKLAESPADERMRIDRELAWNDPEVAALRQAVLVANVKQELVDELRRLGVNVEKVLEEAKAGQATNGTNLPKEGGLAPGMAGMGGPGAFGAGAPAGSVPAAPETAEQVMGVPGQGMPPMY